MCVLFLFISGGTYSLKLTANSNILFVKLFMAILFTLRVFARNLLRGNRRRNTFCILFWCLAWGSNPGLSSNKPKHYLLDYGDYNMTLYHMVDLSYFLHLISKANQLEIFQTFISPQRNWSVQAHLVNNPDWRVVMTNFVCMYVQPFSQDYELAFHTTYVACVKFIHKWRWSAV